MTTLVLTDEQHQLASTLRAFLDRHAPMTKVRAFVDNPDRLDTDLWHLLVEGIGVAGMAAPTERGGGGATVRDLAVVCEEIGYSLIPLPVVPSAVMAVTLLSSLDAPAARDLLDRLTSGEALGSVALLDAAGEPDVLGRGLDVAVDSGGVRLTGGRGFVPFGRHVDIVLVPAATAEGTTLAAIAPDACGVRIEELDGVDPTTPLVTLSMADAPATVLSLDAGSALAHAYLVGVVCIAAEQLGGIRRSVESTSDYVRERVQFGRAVGSFGAVKGGCAEMYVQYELARTAVMAATGALDSSASDVEELVHLAQQACAVAYRKVSADAIHFHGGVGYTWEHDAHLYFRRARTSSFLLGSDVHHRRRLLTPA